MKGILTRLVRLPLFPNFLKILILRCYGEIGFNCKIGNKSFIHTRKLRIGHNVRIAANVTIQSDEVIIGNDTQILDDVLIVAKKKVEIGAECIISRQVTIAGLQTLESEFIMGKRVQIFPFSYLNAAKKLTLEDGAGVGGGSYIFTHGSWQDAYDGFPYEFAPVTIKKNAWLSWRVFVMPGVTIGEEAAIGPDSLVTKNIPSRSFAVGVPARVVQREAEYVKDMTTEQKSLLMKEILLSFSSNQFCFKNRKSELNVQPDRLCLLFDDHSQVIYTLEKMDKVPDKTLVLTELGNNTRIQMHVFDLKNKRCKWPLNELEKDFHTFLGYYGIRLDIEGRYA